ncbi:MAG: AAA family ATPase [Acidobacteria bacterium]|nr:AAA family ATPase [Acidobacteriota bacterium]
MIRRFYVHNYRCLENFELPVSRQSSLLLLGDNGAGKTTVGFALEILQKIARGVNRVGQLVAPEDLAWGRSRVPMRFEVEAELDGAVYEYVLALELPEHFKELRVREEKLTVGGDSVYTRAAAEVRLAGREVPRAGRGPASPEESEAQFRIDWHLVALPIVQARSANDPLAVFKDWLARMLILRPVPSLIAGESSKETLQPNTQVTDFGAWFSGILANTPAAYTDIEEYLRQLMPDLKDIKNPLIGKDSRSLVVAFSNETGSMSVPFKDLSDGEKCFMICGLVLAAARRYGPLVCFWDEPDNHLAPSEVGHFVMALRRAFQSGGQFIATSHNPEAIRTFSEENTLVLYRRSHLEPTVVRVRSELPSDGDFVGALIRGEFRT